MTLTPQQFVELSNRLSDEIRTKHESVQFESNFEDGNAKFFFYNKDRTYCVGFNTTGFGNDLKEATRLSAKYMRACAKTIVELEAAK